MKAYFRTRYTGRRAWGLRIFKRIKWVEYEQQSKYQSFGLEADSSPDSARYVGEIVVADSIA